MGKTKVDSKSDVKAEGKEELAGEKNVGKEVIVKVDKYNQNSLFGKIINLDTKAA